MEREVHRVMEAQQSAESDWLAKSARALVAERAATPEPTTAMRGACGVIFTIRRRSTGALAETGLPMTTAKDVLEKVRKDEGIIRLPILRVRKTRSTISTISTISTFLGH